MYFHFYCRKKCPPNVFLVISETNATMWLRKISNYSVFFLQKQSRKDGKFFFKKGFCKWSRHNKSMKLEQRGFVNQSLWEFFAFCTTKSHSFFRLYNLLYNPLFLRRCIIILEQIIDSSSIFNSLFFGFLGVKVNYLWTF